MIHIKMEYSIQVFYFVMEKKINSKKSRLEVYSKIIIIWVII